jgi:hypothetical protein
MSDKRMLKWRLDSVFVFIGMFLIGWVRLYQSRTRSTTLPLAVRFSKDATAAAAFSSG